MSGLWTEGFWVDFAAGWVSGAASVVACQPLDTVLTRFQAGRGIVGASGAAAATSGGGEIGLVALGSSVRGLAREFGIFSLWRGASPMIGVVPFQNALLMSGYGFGKQYSSSQNETAEGESRSQQHALLPIFVGGCAGGVLQSFLISPVEWIKVHQQTAGAASTSQSTRSLAKTLFRHKGSLWDRGLVATLLRDGIPHGVWFASYEYCKTEMLQRAKNESLETGGDDSSGGYYESATVPLVSGAFAASTAWAVGYPFDIIKTRIQATTAMEGSVPGVFETAKQLVVEADGHVVRGLYRGFGLKLVRSIPASMIGFFTYEFVSQGLTRSA